MPFHLVQQNAGQGTPGQGSFRWGLALVVGVLGALIPWKAGAESHFGPDWTSPQIIFQQPNGSFLADHSQTIRSTEAEFFQGLIDQELAQRKRYEYQRLIDEYERSKAHDRYGLEGQRRHASRLNQFSRSVFNEARNIRVQREAAKLKTRAENNDDFASIGQTVQVVALVAAVMQGEEMVIHLDPVTQLRARTDVPSQRGEFTLISPWVNSQLKFVGHAPEYRDPYAAPPEDPTERAERFKFTISKDIKALAMNTGIDFGSTTRTVAATVSKRLTNSLTWMFSASNYQDTMKLIYKLRF